MKVYNLYRKQLVNSSIAEVWDFFSSPENLDELTPGDMGFDIITERPIPKMYEGQIIEYKVRPILNIPLFWRTEITSVEQDKSFVDEQRKGPYSLWRHKHIFEQHPEGVMMTDSLEYALPLGPLGSIAHTLYVKSKLQQIFDFRYEKVESIFNQKPLL